MTLLKNKVMEVSMCKIEQFFSDQKLIVKIQSRLPYLFQLAELESMRGWKNRHGSWLSKRKNNCCTPNL